MRRWELPDVLEPRRGDCTDQFPSRREIWEASSAIEENRKPDPRDRRKPKRKLWNFRSLQTALTL